LAGVSADLVIANIERAGDHAVVMGVVFAIVVLGGLVYGLVRLASRSRASRPRTAPRTPRDRGSDG
jgi:hypothetical protein